MMPADYARPGTEDPTTQELRTLQDRREAAERRGAHRAPTEEDLEKHRRRASKAAYLREKLEQRAEAEREQSGEE